MSLPTDSMPQTERGSKEKGCSGHGLRKASATIAAESGATEAELNAMFGWSGHQMAQLYTWKADRRRLAARVMQEWTRPPSDDVVGVPEPAFLQLEKAPENAARTTVVTTYAAVVTTGEKLQSNQLRKAKLVGEEGLEPSKS
jgi:hypothetical protein